jgi:hypothetical protein
MSIRNFAAAVALTVFAAPLMADIPDGQGSRTSPQASARNIVATSAHACCPRAIVSAAPLPASPAERKAIGEVAWDSRYGTKTTETVACYKMATSRTAAYSSASELKTVGHLNRTAVAASSDATQCCDSVVCPMHRVS